MTPPQLIVGDKIQNVPAQTADVKCFTLPFSLQPVGVLYLVLSFNAA